MSNLTPAAPTMPPPPQPDISAAELSGPAPARALPVLHSPLDPSTAMERLGALAKRGKLPGFEDRSEADRVSHSDTHAFRVLVFGNPYDRELLGAITPQGEGSKTELESRLLRKFPTIVVVVMALALWPGVWLTDSMLATYFSWYPNNFWITAAWYLPLTLLCIPVLWKQFKKSEAGCATETAELLKKIAAAINAGK